MKGGHKIFATLSRTKHQHSSLFFVDIYFTFSPCFSFISVYVFLFFFTSLSFSFYSLFLYFSFYSLSLPFLFLFSFIFFLYPIFFLFLFPSSSCLDCQLLTPNDITNLFSETAKKYLYKKRFVMKQKRKQTGKQIKSFFLLPLFFSFYLSLVHSFLSSPSFFFFHCIRKKKKTLHLLFEYGINESEKFASFVTLVKGICSNKSSSLSPSFVFFLSLFFILSHSPFFLCSKNVC